MIYLDVFLACIIFTMLTHDLRDIPSAVNQSFGICGVSRTPEIQEAEMHPESHSPAPPFSLTLRVVNVIDIFSRFTEIRICAKEGALDVFRRPPNGSRRV